MALYDTVLNIVSDTAVELGLGALTAVYASTDPNIVQLRVLLKKTGRKLILENTWLQSTKEHSFTTTLKSTYSLPSDFSSMVAGTGWNRTTQQPLRAMSAGQWQRLKARDEGSVVAALFRPRDTELEVWPQPPSPGELIAFDYLSRYWVRATASDDPDKDAPTVDTDVVHLDSLLITRALKFEFLRTKGFDSLGAQADFEETFNAVRSAAAPVAEVMDLTGGCSDGYLSEANLPLTGFGDN